MGSSVCKDDGKSIDTSSLKSQVSFHDFKTIETKNGSNRGWQDLLGEDPTSFCAVQTFGLSEMASLI